MDNPAYVCSPNDEQGKPSYNSSSLTIPPASTCNNNIVKSNGNHEHQHEQLTPRWQSVGAGKEEEEEQDASMTPARCGIFFWKPDCLQRFPTKRWFIAVFLLATTIKGMSGSYFPSTISSVEKRLKVSTETIGYITSGNEISQILFALVLSYVGGKGHRPRWMALGMLASALAYFLYATPHFLYGAGNEALSYTAEYYAYFHNSTDISLINLTSSKNLSADLKADGICKTELESVSAELDCGLGDDSIFPLALIFVSQFVAGIGSVLLYTLAGPFIDDHMKPLQAPVMIAVTGAVRQTGPLIGYVVAFMCLRVFVSPWLTPLITNKDDRWLGAWWIGSVFFAVSMALVSCLMVLFPPVLRTSTKKQKTNDDNVEMSVSDTSESKEDFKENIKQEKVDQARRTEPIHQDAGRDLKFWASLVDLMKNKINLWNNLAILCFGFAFSGFGTYFPKYLETVIKQNAANAALTTGLSSIFFQVAGLLLSGYLISKFRLRARTLAGVNVFVDILIVMVVLSFSQLVCKQGELVDTSSLYMGDGGFSNHIHFGSSNDSDTSTLAMPDGCSSNCNCARGQITPVCYQDKNLMFYSACHAGCKSYDTANQLYSNCSCLPSPEITLSPGKCVDPNACFSTFVVFVSLMAMVRFGSSFGRIGNVLIPYRCVDRSQKSLASGLSFVMWSIVSIPSPIMYGKIIDATCIKWGSKCGGRGNCLLYDDVKFAYALSLPAATLSLLGLICDVMLWYYVKDLKLYGEDNQEVKKNNSAEQSAEK